MFIAEEVCDASIQINPSGVETRACSHLSILLSIDCEDSNARKGLLTNDQHQRVRNILKDLCEKVQATNFQLRNLHQKNAKTRFRLKHLRNGILGEVEQNGMRMEITRRFREIIVKENLKNKLLDAACRDVVHEGPKLIECDGEKILNESEKISLIESILRSH